MKLLVTSYATLDRLAKSFPVLSFLIAMTMTMTTFSYYHIVGFIYLLLDGLHWMIRGYRTEAYDRLVSDPQWVKNLTPGTIVYTDKKFNAMITVWCLLLALFKGGASFVQFQYFAPNELCAVSFYIAISLAILVVISEVILLGIIGMKKQAEFLSIYMETPFEYYQGLKQGCQAFFRVIKSPDSSPTIGAEPISSDLLGERAELVINIKGQSGESI